MAHFAHIKNDTVCSVIVIEQETLDENNGWSCPQCGEYAAPSEWVQTSYNTYGGVHTKGGTPLRKNFAGIGYSYDRKRDAFIAPSPFPSWTLDEATCTWVSPKERPSGSAVEWKEDKKDWEPYQ